MISAGDFNHPADTLLCCRAGVRVGAIVLVAVDAVVYVAVGITVRTGGYPSLGK